MLEPVDPVSFQLCKMGTHKNATVGKPHLNLKDMKSVEGSTTLPTVVKDAVSHVQHMISQQAVALNTLQEIHHTMVNTLTDLASLDLGDQDSRTISSKSPTHNSPTHNPLTNSYSLDLEQPQIEGDDNDLMLDVSKSVPAEHTLARAEPTGEEVRRDALHKIIAVIEWFESLKEPPRTGSLHDIVTGGWFNLISTLAIILNAATIAYYADYDMKQVLTYGSGYTQSNFRWYVGLFFVSVYLVEVTLKICVHRIYFFVGRDMGWNIFDFALIMLGLLDAIMEKLPNVWPISGANFMRLLRLLKVVRILRTIRVLKFFRELRVMLLALLQSTMSLFWCMVMIMFIMYMFGLVFIQGANNWILDHEAVSPDPYFQSLVKEKFNSLGQTMLTLYQSVTGGQDWAPIYRMAEQLGFAYSSLFLFFTIFFMFAVVNIVTAIYVDNVQKNSQPDQQEILDDWRRTQKLQRQTITRLVNELDTDKSGSISEMEFSMISDNEQMIALLETLGINVNDAELLFHLMTHHARSAGHEEVDRDAFLHGLLKIKGRASAVDLHVLSFQVKLVHQAHKKLELNVFKALHKMTDALHKSSLELRLVRSAMPTASTVNLHTASPSNLTASWRLPEVPTERNDDPVDKHTATKHVGGKPVGHDQITVELPETCNEGSRLR